MTSVKLKFRPSSRTGAEGTLFFRITRGRRSRVVFTGCRILPCEWDARTSSVRPCGDPSRRELAELAAGRARADLRRLESAVAALESSGRPYEACDVVSAYRRLPPFRTWFGFLSDAVRRKEEEGRAGTARAYRSALSSFRRFRGGRDMCADTLTGATLSSYESWLRGRGLRRNTSSCYLRALRTVYFRAVRAGLATDRGVFRHVFTGYERTVKRALPASVLREVRGLELPAGSPRAFARDMFMLSFYLQGTSFADLAFLRKSDLRDGLLRYCRRKTGRCVSVGWEPEMEAVVRRYSGLTEGSPYLLPVITRRDGTERAQYERAAHNVNRNLKKIGRALGLRMPLTTYVARHSWATSMRDAGCGLPVISAGLGHESLKTTQVYLSDIDASAVSDANRMMLDKVLGRGGRGRRARPAGSAFPDMKPPFRLQM